MPQNIRVKKLDSFREGKVKVLVCTDVASRGLDIPEVEVVLNIHCPKDIDTLVHRSGRTARMGKPGKSILITDSDDRKRLARYKKDLGGPERVKNVEVSMRALEPLRADVDRLKEVEKSIFREEAKSRDDKWKQKISQQIDIELSDEDKPKKPTDDEVVDKSAVKRRILDKRTRAIQQSIGKKDYQQVNSFKKNVYLAPTDMKRLAQELATLRTQSGEKTRSESKGMGMVNGKKQGYRFRERSRTQSKGANRASRSGVTDENTAFGDPYDNKILGNRGTAKRFKDRKSSSVKSKKRYRRR